MPTRNVVLTDRQEALIETLVERGVYQNASEVLREGVRLIEEREAENAAKLQRLREAVQVGQEDVAHGRVTRFETAEDLERYLDEVTELVINHRRP